MADASPAFAATDPSTADNVFLVGLMGAGKSTIGRQLARRLGKQFHDSDHEIERRTGASIPWIFEIEGEAGFRAREKTVIDELTRRSGVVLATGGGAILDPENRRRLHERGLVIYLRAPLDMLVERTRRDRHRPLLQGVDHRQRLESLLGERDPLYREAAHLIIDTGRRTVRHVVSEILKRAQLG